MYHSLVTDRGGLNSCHLSLFQGMAEYTSWYAFPYLHKYR